MGLRVIPITPYADFSEQVDLDGTTFTLRFRWSERASNWHLDLSYVDGTPIASGLKLVTGWPLLWRSTHPLRPLGDLYVIDMQRRDAEPNFDGLGTRWVLMYQEAGT